MRTESNNLAGLPEHASRVAAMKARLVEVGKNGPPPAYKFLGAEQETAIAAACANMEGSGCEEPSDWVNPDPDHPHPPVPPAPHTGIISKEECTRAGGVLDKKAIACCPKALCGGKCGGKDCKNNGPGGRQDCCSHEIVTNGRACATTVVAPCHGDQ